MFQRFLRQLYVREKVILNGKGESSAENDGGTECAECRINVMTSRNISRTNRRSPNEMIIQGYERISWVRREEMNLKGYLGSQLLAI